MNASEPVGTIGALWRFPVKSMLGEELDAADVSEGGIVGDRAYALVDKETGKVASAKHPKLWPDLLGCQAAFVEPPRPGDELPPARIDLADGTSVLSDTADVDTALSDDVRSSGRRAGSARDTLVRRPKEQRMASYDVPCGRPRGALLLRATCGRLRCRSPDARSGRPASVSTEDRLALASVGDCGSVDIVVWDGRCSSEAGAPRIRPRGSHLVRSGSEGPQTSHTRSSPRVVRSGSARSGWCARGHSTRRCEGARGRLGTVPARAVTGGDVAEGFVGGHPTAWKSIECGILVLLVNRCLDRVRVANPNPHHGPGQPGWQGAALTPAARGVGPYRSKGMPSGRAMAHRRGSPSP